MAPSRRLLVTMLALLISASFIAAGYVLSSPFDALRANAVSTEELLRDYAKKDTDSDGLPDWQEELYGADPKDAHSLDPVLSDKEAVDQGAVAPRFVSEAPVETRPSPESYFDGEPGPAAGSYTEEFARRFFEVYMTAGGGDLDQGTEQRILDGLITEFAAKASARFASSYTSQSVRTSASVSLPAYVTSVETIMLTHQVEDEGNDPVLLIQAYVEQGDASARTKLIALSAAYTAIASDLVRVEVPTVRASDHLALITVFDTLAKSTQSVAREYETDPVMTFGALAAIEPSLTILDTGFASLYTAFVATREAGVPNGTGAVLAEITGL